MVPEQARRWQSQVELTLRLATPADDRVLADLAILGDRVLEPRPYLVAAVGGTVVAATPIGGSETLVVPFTPTQRIVPLLQARADDVRRLVGDARLGL